MRTRFRNRMIGNGDKTPHGWQCPVCNMVNAPSVEYCQHNPILPKVRVPGGLCFVGTHNVGSGTVAIVNADLKRS
jgi:hypothetical protein